MTSNGAVATADVLKRMLRDRKLRQGDKLPSHAKLSRQLGIGIHRLREGLAILAQQGLIETQRKGGTCIRESSLEILHEPIQWHLERMGYTFQDLVRARAAIESAIVEEAVQTRTARDLLALLDAIEQMEKIPRTALDAESEKADECFHMELLKATHNPVMQCFGQLIAEHFNRRIEYQRRINPKELRQTIAMHRNILSAIEKRDANAARKIMRAHVMRQLQGLAMYKKTVRKSQ